MSEAIKLAQLPKYFCCWLALTIYFITSWRINLKFPLTVKDNSDQLKSLHRGCGCKGTRLVCKCGSGRTLTSLTGFWKMGCKVTKEGLINSWVLRKIITFLVPGCQERGSKVIFNRNRNFRSPFGGKVLSSLVYNSHFKMNY